MNEKGTYDFLQYDKIWQRVAPTLSLWGEGPADNAVPGMMPVSAGAVPPEIGRAVPGEGREPCCFGDGARTEMETLEGMLEEELFQQRRLTALGKQAPVWAKGILTRLAGNAGGRAKRLTAVFYLATGECRGAAVCVDRGCIRKWCPALRERYLALACTALRYAQMAEGTEDPCLKKILADLSGSTHRDTMDLLHLLERSLGE